MANLPDPSSEDSLKARAQGPGESGQVGEPEPGELLDQVLIPLLADFEETFARGQVLLDHCPDRVLPPPGRTALRERLTDAQAALAAARALRAAAPTPMALDMATITPWHELVVEVWSLSAALRAAGVELPAP
ncbi:MAG: DUF2605 family protein [Cyanobacteriota bacterium]